MKRRFAEDPSLEKPDSLDANKNFGDNLSNAYEADEVPEILAEQSVLLGDPDGWRNEFIEKAYGKV